MISPAVRAASTAIDSQRGWSVSACAMGRIIAHPRVDSGPTPTVGYRRYSGNPPIPPLSKGGEGGVISAGRCVMVGRFKMGLVALVAALVLAGVPAAWACQSAGQ